VKRVARNQVNGKIEKRRKAVSNLILDFDV